MDVGLNSLRELFPQVDVRILKGAIMTHGSNLDEAIEFVVNDVLPTLPKKDENQLKSKDPGLKSLKESVESQENKKNSTPENSSIVNSMNKSFQKLPASPMKSSRYKPEKNVLDPNSPSFNPNPYNYQQVIHNLNGSEMEPRNQNANSTHYDRGSPFVRLPSNQIPVVDSTPAPFVPPKQKMNDVSTASEIFSPDFNSLKPFYNSLDSEQQEPTKHFPPAILENGSYKFDKVESQIPPVVDEVDEFVEVAEEMNGNDNKDAGKSISSFNGEASWQAIGHGMTNSAMLWDQLNKDSTNESFDSDELDALVRQAKVSKGEILMRIVAVKQLGSKVNNDELFLKSLKEEGERLKARVMEEKQSLRTKLSSARHKLKTRESVIRNQKMMVNEEGQKFRARLCDIKKKRNEAIEKLEEVQKSLEQRVLNANKIKEDIDKEWEEIDKEMKRVKEEMESELAEIKLKQAEFDKEENQINDNKELLQQRNQQVDDLNSQLNDFCEEVGKTKLKLNEVLDSSSSTALLAHSPHIQTVNEKRKESERMVEEITAIKNEVDKLVLGFKESLESSLGDASSAVLLPSNAPKSSHASINQADEEGKEANEEAKSLDLGNVKLSESIYEACMGALDADFHETNNFVDNSKVNMFVNQSTVHSTSDDEWEKLSVSLSSKSSACDSAEGEVTNM